MDISNYTIKDIIINIFGNYEPLEGEFLDMPFIVGVFCFMIFLCFVFDCLKITLSRFL